MQNSNSLKKLNLFFIVSFPVLGLVSFLKSGNINKYYLSVLSFLVFYGMLFVLPSDGDAYRHYQSFLTYDSFSFAELSTEIKNILYLRSENYTDLYLLLSNYFISRFSNSISVYFGFHAFIYGLIYLATLKLILKDIKVHKSFLTTIFFLLIVFIAPIAKIQYVRYFLASWLFLYGTIGYLRLNKIKYLFFTLFAILVHFSFIIPVSLFLIFSLFKKQFFLWFVIAVFSFSANNILSQYGSNILNLSASYLGSSVMNDKSKAYVGNEEYIEQRDTRFENRRWYANPSKYLSWAYTIMLFFIGICFLLKKIKIEGYLLILFTFSLFMFSISELGQAFASLGERLQQVSFIVSSIFFFYFFHQNFNKSIRNLAFFCTPLYLIFLVMALREFFLVGDLFIFIGNPILALFVERSSFLYYLIP